MTPGLLVQNVLGLLVCELSLGMDHRFTKFIVHHFQILSIYFDQHTECESIHPLIQTALNLGQIFGEHLDSLLAQVISGSPFESLPVNPRIGMHKMGDVCDVNPQGYVLFKKLNADSIVNVGAAFGIN